MKVATTQTPDAGAMVNQLGDQVNRTISQGAQGVIGSLQRAAAATGVDFGYLVKTAHRESALNPNAHARTSSAGGLFQFIDQTWLSMLKNNGAKHGYGAYAAQIVKTGKGQYTVPDPGVRRQVMGLKYNPDANAVMAAEMTAGHAAYLKGRIGRDPTQGELYAAHFLGPDGAADLIQASARQPAAAAASLFPQAARSNHGIFYHGGRALNVAEVMANLTSVGNGSVHVNAPEAAPDTNSNPFITARLNKVRADEAVMQMVFGGQDQQGTLFTAQLMSAFGPGKDGDDDSSGQNAENMQALTRAFGSANGLLG